MKRQPQLVVPWGQHSSWDRPVKALSYSPVMVVDVAKTITRLIRVSQGPAKQEEFNLFYSHAPGISMLVTGRTQAI